MVVLLAEFKSIYKGLSFKVNGIYYKFRNGKFKTEVKEVIEALEKLAGVERVDQPQPEQKAQPELKKEESQKEVPQPKTKTKTKKK